MAGNSHSSILSSDERERLHQRVAELERLVARNQQSEDDLRTVFDCINDALFIHTLDETGNILDVNQAMLELYRIDYQTATNLTVQDFSSPANDLNDIARVLLQAIAGEVPTFEWRARRPGDGSEFDVEVTLRKLYFRRQFCILATVRDITEQKRMQEEMRRSNAILQGFLDHLPALMFVRDTEGHFVVVNRYYANLLKHDPSDIIGKTPHEVVAADAADLFLANDQVVLETGQVLEREEVSSLGIFMAIKFPIYDAHHKIVAIGGISTDISERVALQQQVIDAQRMALRELSTPLIPISDTVMVMPLIGAIDSQRAQLVLETLLEGVAQYQAELVIVDITGVQVVDSQVADALIRAARAVRLLGARVMLTGIQPQIAQTLVHLGIQLDGILTQCTLQAGIALALQEAA